MIGKPTFVRAFMTSIVTLVELGRAFLPRNVQHETNYEPKNI